MDLASFISDLPITLANFHSASCHGVPVGTLRNRHLYEHENIDNGGSGIYVHRPNSTTFQTYQLKCDSMGTSPFYPKCFTLPLITSPTQPLVNPNKFQFNRNYFNSLFYDKEIDGFFYANPVNNCLQLYGLERGEEAPFQSKLILVSSASSVCQLDSQDGPICEISHFDSQSDRNFFIRQPKSISLLKLDDQDGELLLCPERFTLDPQAIKKRRLHTKFNSDTEYWKLSQSHLLKHNLAIGQFDKDDCVTLSDYNMETKQFLWVCSSSQTDFKNSLSWQSPAGLDWVKDHPKLLAYCELNQFALLDTRSNCSLLSIMDRNRLEFARDWEKFRSFCQLSISDTQFLLSLDHKVILVDRRYPQKNLLTWNHMLPVNIENLPRFLSSTSIANQQSIITLSNTNESTLMTVNPFELANIVQPKSLHIPMKLSQTTDCWYYSSNSNYDLRDKLEKYSTVTGLIVIPAENGYSIIQSTIGDNLFVQDFYPNSTIEPEHRISWNRSCLPEYFPIPSEIDSLLKYAFSSIQGETESVDCLEAKYENDKQLGLVAPLTTVKPKLLMPLPGLSSDANNKESVADDHSDDELVNGELIEEIIEKRGNLLGDDLEAINETQLTIKLLSKWRGDKVIDDSQM